MPERQRYLWRISNHPDLQGIGGLRASARWHTRGRAVVYCAEAPTGALLEALVHLEVDSIDALPKKLSAPPHPVPGSGLPGGSRAVIAAC